MCMHLCKRSKTKERLESNGMKKDGIPIPSDEEQHLPPHRLTDSSK